jgi:protein DJ-1
MPRALILVADGSEEIEFVTPYDGRPMHPNRHYQPLNLYSQTSAFYSPYPSRLRSHFHGCGYQESKLRTVCSLPIHLDFYQPYLNCSMTRTIRIVPDHPTVQSPPFYDDNYDILILPGGGPGAKTFCANEHVLNLIFAYRHDNKWVAAICAGTTALVAADEMHSAGKSKVTSHPSVMEEIKGKGWEYSEERVVVDDKVITSRG